MDEISASSEELRREVRNNLLAGTWSPHSGYPLGLEEDIEGDLNELERQLRPLSGRAQAAVPIGALLATLSEYLVEVAKRSASPLGRERVDQLREDVIDRIASFDGSQDDLTRAFGAMDALAFDLNWTNLPASPDTDDGEWEAFVQFAENNKITTAAALLDWTPGAVLPNTITVAGGTAAFAGGVAYWAGAGTQMSSGVGTIVFAVIAAILGYLRNRFRKA